MSELVKLGGTGGGVLRVRRALARGSLCRALAVAFRPPTATLAEELRGLAEPLPKDEGDRLRRLAERVGPELACEYHRLLGPGGGCPIAESDYFPERMMGGKGALLGDAAAFYAAFRFDPAAELRASPDHLAIELSFLGWLHLKVAHALHAGLTEEAAITEDAVAKFAFEHVDPWIERFSEKLEGVAGDGFYGEAARALRASWTPVEVPPGHPPLGPDLLAFAGIPEVAAAVEGAPAHRREHGPF